MSSMSSRTRRILILAPFSLNPLDTTAATTPRYRAWDWNRW